MILKLVYGLTSEAPELARSWLVMRLGMSIGQDGIGQGKHLNKARQRKSKTRRGSARVFGGVGVAKLRLKVFNGARQWWQVSLLLRTAFFAAFEAQFVS